MRKSGIHWDPSHCGEEGGDCPPSNLIYLHTDSNSSVFSLQAEGVLVGTQICHHLPFPVLSLFY